MNEKRETHRDGLEKKKIIVFEKHRIHSQVPLDFQVLQINT